MRSQAATGGKSRLIAGRFRPMNSQGSDEEDLSNLPEVFPRLINATADERRFAKPMKPAAIAIIVLALLVGVLPQFTDCQSQGKAIQLPNGNTLPMKCHWTARAELALAVPWLLSGVCLLRSRQPESRRLHALTSMTLALGVILLPTVLVGVCAKPDMLCLAVMKPMLILVGVLGLVLGALCMILGGQSTERRG